MANTELIKNKFPDEPLPSDGKIVNYTIENGRIKGIEGLKNADFVITKDGELIIGKRHHFLGNGQDVMAAGQLKINGNGQIKGIDNLSGHYRPAVSEAMNYPDLFRNLGLDLNNTWINLYDIQINSTGDVVKLTPIYTKILK